MHPSQLVVKSRDHLNHDVLGEISDYHDEYKDGCLLGCCVVCSMVDIDQRFKGAFCLHHQGDVAWAGDESCIK
jgi:hypothetical protein